MPRSSSVVMKERFSSCSFPQSSAVWRLQCELQKQTQICVKPIGPMEPSGGAPAPAHDLSQLSPAAAPASGRTRTRHRRRKLKDEDEDLAIATETERLDAAKAQLTMVKMRLEDVRSQLLVYQSQQNSAMSVEITPQCVIGLKNAFKQDITDVFAAFSNPVVEFYANGEADADGEASAAETAGLMSADATSAPISASFLPPGGEAITATFRVHDVFTFGELRENMCIYLNALHQYDSMELYDPVTNSSWKESDMVLQAAKLTPIDGRIVLRYVRIRPPPRETFAALAALPAACDAHAAAGAQPRPPHAGSHAPARCPPACAHALHAGSDVGEGGSPGGFAGPRGARGVPGGDGQGGRRAEARRGPPRDRLRAQALTPRALPTHARGCSPGILPRPDRCDCHGHQLTGLRDGARDQRVSDDGILVHPAQYGRPHVCRAHGRELHGQFPKTLCTRFRR